MHHSDRQGTSCAGKSTYPTIGECERAQKAMGKRGFRSSHRRDVHPYRCNSCNGWHLSSMTHGEYEERMLYRMHPRFA